MKRIQQNSRKLRLDKQVVRTLGREALAQAVGGEDTSECPFDRDPTGTGLVSLCGPC